MASWRLRRFIPRFSLRTLIVFTLLATSATALWMHRAAWVRLPAFRGTNPEINHITFLHARSQVAAADTSDVVELWPLSSEECSKKVETNSAIIGISPAMRLVVTHPRDYEDASVVDALTGEVLCELKGHKFQVAEAAFGEDDTAIATAGYDGTVRIWDGRSGTCRKVIEASDFHMVYSVDFFPGGHMVVAGDSDGSATIFDVGSGACIRSLEACKTGITSVDVSPDGSFIVGGTYEGGVRLWNASTGRVVWHRAMDKGTIGEVVFSGDGDRIAAANAYGPNRVYDAKNGNCIAVMGKESCDVAFSPDGRHIAVADRYFSLAVFRRRRPEWWWGVFWLPELYATAFFSLLLIWSVWRDRKHLQTCKSE